MTLDGAWTDLPRRYVHDEYSAPLRRILTIAKLHDVKSIVVERRYIDIDWRSQLSRFFNGTFRRFPSVCHRLHFFTTPIDNDFSQLDAAQSAYRGYTILRPYPLAPVGRTMIAAPPELADAIRCEATESIELAGREFSVRAMPFISQDFQYLRCAHAAIWMVLAHGRLEHGMPRRLPEDIHEAGTLGAHVGRRLPSDGLTGHQILAALEGLGLSPGKKILPRDKPAEEAAGPLRLYTIMRRYLNSSLPPLVTSDTHAWVVVAYQTTGSAGDPNLTLWRHDDSLGPYLRVDDPWDEPLLGHRPWVNAFLPLPPKAYVDAERAAAVAREWIAGFQDTEFAAGTTLEIANQRDDEADRATYRTYLIPSSAYKKNLAARGLHPELLNAYRLAPMSRLIWVVELVDPIRRRRGEPDVLGEIILDATLTLFDPIEDEAAGLLAGRIDHIVVIPGVDGAQTRDAAVPPGEFYRSGCPAFPANQPLV